MRKLGIGFIVLIVFVAIFSRLYFLDYRVLHHDEGVNYFFADKILKGEGYSYDPLNYHGPFYFYLVALSFFIFGISEFALRFPAAVFGILIALFPLIFKIGNWKERIITGLFLLLSPSLIYYSRYSIHEAAFVFCSLACVYTFSLIIEKRSLEYLPIFALALAGMFVLKETAIIMLFVLFVLGIFNWKRIRKINFRDNYLNVLFFFIFFFVIYILFFSSFFSNFKGLMDSLKAFLPWIDRGLHEVGHDKPFYYYLTLILQYELPILLFAFIGLLNFKKIREKIFYFNAFIWFILIFLIYSFISYKTPWLVINMIVPMCFLAGFGLNNIKWKGKWILLASGIIYLAYFSVFLNFVSVLESDNELAYVHTNSDVLGMIKKIDDIYNEGDKILVVSDELDYWPLPFYLRDKEVLYLPEQDLKNYSEIEDYKIIILREEIFNEKTWENYRYEDYELRENVDFFVVWED